MTHISCTKKTSDIPLDPSTFPNDVDITLLWYWLSKTERQSE